MRITLRGVTRLAEQEVRRIGVVPGFETEDLRQEALMVALTRLGKLDTERSTKTQRGFVCTVMRNHLINLKRDSYFAKRMPRAPDGTPLRVDGLLPFDDPRCFAATQTPSQEDPESSLVAREMVRVLDAGLDADERAIFIRLLEEGASAARCSRVRNLERVREKVSRILDHMLTDDEETPMAKPKKTDSLPACHVECTNESASNEGYDKSEPSCFLQCSDKLTCLPAALKAGKYKGTLNDDPEVALHAAGIIPTATILERVARRVKVLDAAGTVPADLLPDSYRQRLIEEQALADADAPAAKPEKKSKAKKDAKPEPEPEPEAEEEDPGVEGFDDEEADSEEEDGSEEEVVDGDEEEDEAADEDDADEDSDEEDDSEEDATDEEDVEEEEEAPVTKTSDKPAKAKAAKPPKAEKPPKAAKPEKAPKPAKAKPEKPAKAAKAEKAAKPAKAPKVAKPKGEGKRGKHRSDLPRIVGGKRALPAPRKLDKPEMLEALGRVDIGAPFDLKIGMEVSREQRSGKAITVQFATDGFVLDGETYPSLTAAAMRAVERSISGNAFFSVATSGLVVIRGKGVPGGEYRKEGKAPKEPKPTKAKAEKPAKAAKKAAPKKTVKVKIEKPKKSAPKKVAAKPAKAAPKKAPPTKAKKAAKKAPPPPPPTKAKKAAKKK